MDRVCQSSIALLGLPPGRWRPAFESRLCRLQTVFRRPCVRLVLHLIIVELSGWRHSHLSLSVHSPLLEQVEHSPSGVSWPLKLPAWTSFRFSQSLPANLWVEEGLRRQYELGVRAVYQARVYLRRRLWRRIVGGSGSRLLIVAGNQNQIFGGQDKCRLPAKVRVFEFSSKENNRKTGELTGGLVLLLLSLRRRGRLFV